MKQHAVWAAITSLVVTASATSSDTKPAPAKGADAILPAVELDRLRERWRQAMDEVGVAGMAIVAVKDDQVVLLETFGYRDPVQRLPVTPDTKFYIASCTKLFTAMGIMALSEEGKVNLDAPVRSYLPRLELPDKELTAQLTVRDLLSHAKGINMGGIVFLDAYTGQINEDRYYTFLKDATIGGQPKYTNVHFTLLGRVIEAASGRKWQDYLDTRIFDPAGMTSTTAYASELYSGDSAIPCKFEDGKIVPTETRKTDATMHAAGGTGASIKDLARWLRLNMNGGEIDGVRIVSAESVQAMQTLETKMPGEGNLPNGRRNGVGLGWMIGTYRTEKMIDHGGGYTGTSAGIFILPEKRIGIAGVANGSVPVPAVAVIDLLEHMLGAEKRVDMRPKLVEMAKDRQKRAAERQKEFPQNPMRKEGALSLAPEAYAGKYSNDLWGTIQFAVRDGELDADFGDLPTMIGTTGKDEIQLGYEDDTPNPGHFEIEAGNVKGLKLRLREDAEEITFKKE